MTRERIARVACVVAASCAAMIPCVSMLLDRAPPLFRATAIVTSLLCAAIVIRGVLRRTFFAPERAAIIGTAVVAVVLLLGYEGMLARTTVNPPDPSMERVQAGFGLWRDGLTEDAIEFIDDPGQEDLTPQKLLLAKAAFDTPDVVWKGWTIVAAGVLLALLMLGAFAALTHLFVLLHSGAIDRTAELTPATVRPGGRRRLCVVVPGIGCDPDRWDGLVKRLRGETEMAGARWLVVRHRARWWRMGRAEACGRAVSARIDQEWRKCGGFDEVLLLGHSVGGLFVRHAYLLGAGACAHGEKCDWAAKVSRIVLFASLNRGLNTDRFWLGLLGWFLCFTQSLQRFLLNDLLRGSEYVANLRIEWIRHFHAIGREAPTIVQILGSKDGLVERDDSIDLEQFPTAWHVTIDGANHANLFQIDRADDPAGRYAVVRDAILHDVATRGENIRVTGPKKIVFVLHGIRAGNGDWVKGVAKRISALEPDVQVEESRYRRVSAVQFAFPAIRRRRARWLQDRYSYWLAKNPEAEFHFIGHSNGTYLLGRSLRYVPGMRFGRIALAGSVLPVDHWINVRPDQFSKIRNDRAADDIPVSILCSGLRGWFQRDVGTGGFDGFVDVESTRVEEVHWYTGGHGAALDVHNHDHLINFVLKGQMTYSARLLPDAPRRQRWCGLVSRLAPFLFAAGAVAALYLGYRWVAQPEFSSGRLLSLLACTAGALAVLHAF